MQDFGDNSPKSLIWNIFEFEASVLGMMGVGKDANTPKYEIFQNMKDV